MACGTTTGKAGNSTQLPRKWIDCTCNMPVAKQKTVSAYFENKWTTHTHTHAHTQAHSHMHTHTHMHTHMHTHTCTYTHTHTHTHVLTHKCFEMSFCWLLLLTVLGLFRRRDVLKMCDPTVMLIPFPWRHPGMWNWHLHAGESFQSHTALEKSAGLTVHTV